MCLSTAYKTAGDEQDMICEFVSGIDVEDGKVILTDILGERIAVDGVLKKIDLVGGVVVIGAA